MCACVYSSSISLHLLLQQGLVETNSAFQVATDSGTGRVALTPSVALTDYCPDDKTGKTFQNDRSSDLYTLRLHVYVYALAEFPSENF